MDNGFKIRPGWVSIEAASQDRCFWSGPESPALLQDAGVQPAAEVRSGSRAQGSRRRRERASVNRGTLQQGAFVVRAFPSLLPGLNGSLGQDSLPGAASALEQKPAIGRAWLSPGGEGGVIA